MAKPKHDVLKKDAKLLEDHVKALSTVSAKIDAKNAELKALNEQYDQLERKLFDCMKAQGVTTVGTSKATAYITNRVFVKTDDWDAFIAYVFKTEQPDLLQRRVAQRAYLDRLEAGEVVPGLSKIEIPTVNLRSK